MSKSYNIFSWNVNGIRAVIKKGELQNFLSTYHPDLFCIQETKAKSEQKSIDFIDYTEYWNSAIRPGYSGTAIFSQKSLPILSVASGFPDFLNSNSAWQTDSYGSPLSEGRVLTVELAEFYLVTVYTPNSKPDLSRLNLRETLWDPTFLQYLKILEQHKPVVVCGDFNAAHTEIDLARPKDNIHHAGFTPTERQGITNLLDADFIDTFRFLHPDERRYTWWSHWAKAREHNIGWRIDYFFISKSLSPHLTAAEIYESQIGSDHCPISITLQF